MIRSETFQQLFREAYAGDVLARARGGLGRADPDSGLGPELEFVAREDQGAALMDLSRVLYAVRAGNTVRLSADLPHAERMVGVVPAIPAEALGAQGFLDTHGVRYAYVSGAMAGGIASVDLVAAMGKAGMMGFFGAGAVPLEKIEAAILDLKSRLTDGEPFGMNLLHNFYQPAVEMATVELYLKHGVRWVDAAAFMDLSPAVVYYRAKGMTLRSDGKIDAPNHVFAKVSRPEVATHFMAPPPERILSDLVAAGKLTAEEAKLASKLPVAEDITAEADSGGHTDQRPFSVLLPMMLRMRDEAMAKYGFAAHGGAIRIGAGGGIGDPMSAFAALSLGADYLMTGTINQACLQAGTSEAVKRLLLDADMADVAMAPAPDMFEAGARVQVLRRGTLYAQRAQKLYDLYKLYPSFEAVPQVERDRVEKQILMRPFTEVWAEAERYWMARDPRIAAEGQKDLKARMALCFRWYLGMSSRWAVMGDPARRMDYQIWCGPAIGALNRWTKGTWLGQYENRDAPLLAKAILHGTAVLTRREAAARSGVEGLPTAAELSRPVELSELV